MLMSQDNHGSRNQRTKLENSHFPISNFLLYKVILLKRPEGQTYRSKKLRDQKQSHTSLIKYFLTVVLRKYSTGKVSSPNQLRVG